MPGRKTKERASRLGLLEENLVDRDVDFGRLGLNGQERFAPMPNLEIKRQQDAADCAVIAIELRNLHGTLLSLAPILHGVDQVCAVINIDEPFLDRGITRIDNIIGGRLDRKGIIHTRSYKRAMEVVERSKHSSMMMAHNSNNANKKGYFIK